MSDMNPLTPDLRQDYVKIEGVGDSEFKPNMRDHRGDRVDSLVVPWIDASSIVEDILDAVEDDGPSVTLKFTLMRLTDEQFEAICEGSDE